MTAENKLSALLLTFFGLVFLHEACGGYYPCDSDGFLCFTGNCIKWTQRCDGNNDCGDNGDEYMCTGWNTCDYFQVPCSNGPCIQKEMFCDGVEECHDNFDEMFCNQNLQLIVGVLEARRNLTGYFLDLRQNKPSINRWGPHLLRTALALYLTDSTYFTAGVQIGEEIAYEISLQLMTKLAFKKKIATQELSLFVNALIVSCINPKEFFGVDLVAELRSRVNKQNYTNPFSILTLCNAEDTMTEEDVVKLQQQFDGNLRPLLTDTQAFVTMALVCISSRSNLTVDDTWIRDLETELKRKQFKNGTVDNLKSTALVLQALLATHGYEKDFDLKLAVKFMLEEMETKHVPINVLYYILPVLSSKSLVNVSSSHCSTTIKTDLETLVKLHEDSDERIQFQFSMYIGEDMDFVHTWRLKVPSNYTFYQVLETMVSLEPTYKVQYSVSEGKPYVSAMNKYYEDVQDGMFWYIYTRPLSSSKLKLREESPVDLQVKETEELILWYRSRVLSDSS